MAFVAHGFDNRNALRRLYMQVRGRQGYPHYMFRTPAGKQVIYCYIRKNACSAFKHLFLGLSDRVDKPTERSEALAYMNRHHRAVWPSDMGTADHIVFVYRDPLERIVSLYKHKFVVRFGNADIFRNYQKITGETPETATFEAFVTDYLRPEFHRLDPHVLPQRNHLLPIRYSDAIEMSDLQTGMSRVLGADVAQTYFGTPTNRTQSTGDYALEEAWKVPASALHETYTRSGGLPSENSLLTPTLEARLKRLYACDQVFSS